MTLQAWLEILDFCSPSNVTECRRMVTCLKEKGAEPALKWVLCPHRGLNVIVVSLYLFNPTLPEKQVTHFRFHIFPSYENPNAGLNGIRTHKTFQSS